MYELQFKAGPLECKITPMTNEALETMQPCLRQKQIIVGMRDYWWTKSPKLTTETIQTLTERGVAPDIAKQTLDGQSHQNELSL